MLVQVQCCTDDGVWRLVARNVRGNTVKVPALPPSLPAFRSCTSLPPVSPVSF